jgi:hypothetical protein
VSAVSLPVSANAVPQQRSGPRVLPSCRHSLAGLPLNSSTLKTPHCIAHNCSVSSAGTRGLTCASSWSTCISAFLMGTSSIVATSTFALLAPNYMSSLPHALMVATSRAAILTMP